MRRVVVRTDSLLGPDGPGPGASVILAFDDGYRSVFEHAFPILRDAGMSGVMFLVPALVGQESAWERTSGLAPRPLLSWNDAALLIAAGHEIGSHSLSHADLSAVDPSMLAQEVTRSREILMERLGVRIRAFSVPFGKDDPRLNQALIHAGYQEKITNAETVPTQIGPLRIRPCIAILNYDTILDFRRKLTGAYDLLHTLRRWRKR